MEKVRFGIIGLGNMGTGHMNNFKDGKIENGVVTAACDINAQKREIFRQKFGEEIVLFDNATDMINSGLVDCVMVETPHYSHPTLAIEALKAGLHAIVEKPAGVYTKQVREMLDYAKTTDRVLGIMFNQRTNPVFKKMREMVLSGKLGKIKRTNWIITDWYRTEQYYDSGNWRATWSGEGGGVLYNQAPHQLDLFQWIIGMSPSKVRAFCHFGKWHDIEVEDDVTCYVEYPNGATGVFITTTADAPGTNRFEITGTLGKLVFENDKLFFTELEIDEREFCFSTGESFGLPSMKPTVEIECPGENLQHVGIVNNVANTILGLEKLYAPAADGLAGVQLANAMHLSSWLDKEITLPIDEDLFKAELDKKIAASKPRTNLRETIVAQGGTIQVK